MYTTLLQPKQRRLLNVLMDFSIHLQVLSPNQKCRCFANELRTVALLRDRHDHHTQIVLKICAQDAARPTRVVQPLAKMASENEYEFRAACGQSGLC